MAIAYNFGVKRSMGQMSDKGAVTRVELCEAVHAALGLPKTECSKLVDTVLGKMCHALSEGEDVKLSGFGTFLLRDKAERTGRNPKNGDAVSIAPRRVMTFRACQTMRGRVTGAASTRTRAERGHEVSGSPA